MQRDGANESLWQNNMPVYLPKHNIIPIQKFDVIVVGGGITGITTALLLQKAGKKVVLAEAHTIGFGTTGGTTAHLNTLLDTPYNIIAKNFNDRAAEQVATLSAQAINLIKHNIKEYNIDCGYADAVAYLYAQDEKQEKELDEIYNATKAAGVDVSISSKIPVPVPFTKALAAKDQGRFHPAKYIYGIAKAFEDLGGILLQGCAVTAVKDDEYLQIQTSLGVIEAANIIYATHIPPGINLLHFRCAPYRSYAMAFTLKDENYPDGLAYDMYDPYHYFRSQEVDGQQYLIAGGDDHKTGHEENTENCFRSLESYVRKFYNVDEAAFKWSSEYFDPADGLPYIGHLPGSPDNYFVATGFGGNGMTYGTGSAIILCDIITKGQSEYQELFNPNRIKPVAGFANFITENASVVKDFIGMRIGIEKLTELSELAHNEAKIVKYEGKKLGIYKDENGKIHAVNPICTHAKCIVAWNNTEKSWDCPCHGGRFSCDGEVLTGPPREPLEKVELGEM